jgi:hypothetical protein
MCVCIRSQVYELFVCCDKFGKQQSVALIDEVSLSMVEECSGSEGVTVLESG